MDGRTEKQKISPFYRTLSPIGAAALPPPMKTKEKVEQGEGTADHLMPWGYLLLFAQLFNLHLLSSCPNARSFSFSSPPFSIPPSACTPISTHERVYSAFSSKIIRTGVIRTPCLVQTETARAPRWIVKSHRIILQLNPALTDPPVTEIRL